MNIIYQMKKYQSIINSSIHELLKMISWIEYIIMSLNEKKLYIFIEFKFFMIYYEYSIIFLTINFLHLYSFISLFYVEEKINVFEFNFVIYFAFIWLRIMLKNSLIMIEYFHNMIKIIIEMILKEIFLMTCFIITNQLNIKKKLYFTFISLYFLSILFLLILIDIITILNQRYYLFQRDMKKN